MVNVNVNLKLAPRPAPEKFAKFAKFANFNVSRPRTASEAALYHCGHHPPLSSRGHEGSRQVRAITTTPPPSHQLRPQAQSESSPRHLRPTPASRLPTRHA